MRLNVYDHDIIKFLTDDKVLCQNWKLFANAIGLQGEIEILQQMYLRYVPVEETCLYMLEKWERNLGSRINPQNLLDILDKIGFHQTKNRIFEFLKEIDRAKGRRRESRKNWIVSTDCFTTSFNGSFTLLDILQGSANERLGSITIQDPHMQTTLQLKTLELYILQFQKLFPNLVTIHLRTSFDTRKDKSYIRKFQMETLTELAGKLKNYSINFIISFDQTLYLQDRFVEFENDVRFRMVNGLDTYYYVDTMNDCWEKDITSKNRTKPNHVTIADYAG